MGFFLFALFGRYQILFIQCITVVLSMRFINETKNVVSANVSISRDNRIVLPWEIVSLQASVIVRLTVNV